VTNVLHVINGEYYAGAERVQEHLLRGVSAAESFNVSVALYKDGVFPERSALDIQFFPLSGFHPFRLSKLIESESIDLLHCHSPMTLLLASIAARLAKRRVNLIFHVHSPTIEDTGNLAKDYIKYFLERIAVKLGHPIVIGVSSSVIERSRYLDGRKDVIVIDNGVPLNAARVRHCHNDDKTRLVFAGLIRPRKGFDVLVDALGRLSAEECKSIELFVYGEFDSDDYKQEMFLKVADHGLDDVITFCGFDKDVPGRIAEGQIFVLPSLYGEGLPMVLLEAMSVGSAIVASKVGGVDGVIENDRSGILVGAGDPDALAVALRNLVGDAGKREEIGDAALIRQQQNYSTSAMVKSVLALYEKVKR
jgi:glycosyltransferase involved in cell wall biosynthesis